MQHLQKTGEGPHDHQSTPLPRWPELANRPGRLFPRSPSPFNCRVSTSCVPLFHGSRNTDHESRPRYLLTSLPLAALPAPPATLFHPWLANASANISSPISTGAKRSRAPSAFHRTPPCRSCTTIEIDPAFIAGLRHLAKQFTNLAVVPGDILKADLAAIASGRRMRIYGNLPYYITSPILHHLFTFVGLIDEIHIVIQTEVALRLAAQPGTRDYGYLSVVTQFYSRPEFVFEIPRDAFEPPPEVTSALVTLRLPGERAKLALGDASPFLDFVKLCFSQKRKTLVNNLRSLAKPDRVREALATLNLRPDSRAEQLPVAQLAALQALLAGS